MNVIQIGFCIVKVISPVHTADKWADLITRKILSHKFSLRTKMFTKEVSGSRKSPEIMSVINTLIHHQVTL